VRGSCQTGRIEPVNSAPLEIHWLWAINALKRPAWSAVNETHLVGLVTRRDLASTHARSGALTAGGLIPGDFAKYRPRPACGARNHSFL